tara:strand:+ start:753 stop:1034 length:282 start_codon:yes stop_codon:yes gene_type:complete
MEWITSNLDWLGGVGGAGVTLTILRFLPNEDIYEFVEKMCYRAGRVITLGMASRRSPVKEIWNSKIEPWFIDVLENTIGAAVHGIIRGLKTDK